MSESEYKVYGLKGKENVFYINFCFTDRTWRKQLLLTNDKYQGNDNHPFDECRNAFVKPKAPQFQNILDHLHKRSDYEWIKKMKGDQSKKWKQNL